MNKWTEARGREEVMREGLTITFSAHAGGESTWDNVVPRSCILEEQDAPCSLNDANHTPVRDLQS